ncbi:MAG: hypothetical protein GDA55_02505 [Cellvibrionales bacterium]|nr:hypothetical protein [Cellvibrionales bacterium]
MGSLTIRDLDDEVKKRLRVRAAERGHSMQEEARIILGASLGVVRGMPGKELVKVMRELFGPENGVDLDLPPRSSTREVPDFS